MTSFNIQPLTGQKRSYARGPVRRWRRTVTVSQPFLLLNSILKQSLHLHFYTSCFCSCVTPTRLNEVSRNKHSSFHSGACWCVALWHNRTDFIHSLFHKSLSSLQAIPLDQHYVTSHDHVSTLGSTIRTNCCNTKIPVFCPQRAFVFFLIIFESNKNCFHKQH